MAFKISENDKDRSIDDTPITFGKYKGLKPRYIADRDPQYILWMYENVKHAVTCTKELYNQCQYEEMDDEEDQLMRDVYENFMKED
jgi:hypothetical protein